MMEVTKLVERLRESDWHDPKCPFKTHCYCGNDGEVPPHDKWHHPEALEAADTLEAIQSELAAAHATIHQLGEDAAKAAGKYAANIAAMREALHLCASRFQVASVDAMQAGDTRLSVQCITWANDATRAALTETSEGADNAEG